MTGMTPTALHVTPTRLRAGVWEGVLDVTGTTVAPRIEVLHQDTPLPDVVVAADAATPGRYALAVPIPAALVSDGVQTFVIRDAQTGQTLGSFAIVTGAPLDQDLRAEIDLLRAELDLLKRAFRRHCVDTMTDRGD